MPIETRVNINMQEGRGERGKGKLLDLIIAGHLLEGENPDDSSPYVRGDYANKNKLETKAKYRIFKIYRSVYGGFPMTEFHCVRVQCKHGVRVQVVDIGSLTAPRGEGTDQAMTIFETSMSSEAAKKVDWNSASLSDIEKLWKVESNMIPSLHFITFMGGGG